MQMSESQYNVFQTFVEPDSIIEDNGPFETMIKHLRIVQNENLNSAYSHKRVSGSILMAIRRRSLTCRGLVGNPVVG